MILFHLKELFNIPSRGLGIVTIDKIEKIRKIYKLNVFEAIKLVGESYSKKKI